MKKFLIKIFFFLLLGEKAYAENLKFTKIVSLDEPWGSSFINNNEIIITEKSGKIKIINIENGNVVKVNHNLNFLEVWTRWIVRYYL